ncbi:MAG: hypothetical protein B6I24_09865, partial [Bacteroidetes bacterium 4572_128]
MQISQDIIISAVLWDGIIMDVGGLVGRNYYGDITNSY